MKGTYAEHMEETEVENDRMLPAPTFAEVLREGLTASGLSLTQLRERLPPEATPSPWRR